MSQILIILTIISFVLFGVVGEDKTLLEVPVVILNYGVILAWFIKRLFIDTKSVNKIKIPTDISLWIIFFLYGSIITFWSDVIFESKLELLKLGGLIGSFIVWRNEHSSFRSNIPKLGLLVIGVLFCALYGFIIHYKCPDQILWDQRYTDHYDGRLASTYICPNHFAHLMQMFLPFLIIWVLLSKVGILLRIIAAYTFVALLVPLFLTESRAGWLGAILSLGTLGLLFAWRKSKKLFWIMLIIIPVLTSSLLFTSYIYSETFQRRMEPVVDFFVEQSEGGIGSDASDFRPKTWMDTLEMIGNKPIIGYGPATYRYSFPEFRNRYTGKRTVTGHPHNEYLELLSDYGLIGFILFAAAWFCSILRCVIYSFTAKEKRHAFMGFAAIAMISGTMVHSFFDFQMHVYPNAMVFALLLSFALSPLENQKNKNISNNNNYIYGLFVIFFIGFIFSIKVMGSSYMRNYAEKNFISAKGDNNVSLFWSKQAIKWDLTNWKAYQIMGQILYDQRYFSLTLSEKLDVALSEKKAYEKAYLYNKKSPVTCAALGKVNLFLGKNNSEADAAIQFLERGFFYLREACKLRKYNDLYWWTLGSELRNSGFYNESLEVFKKTKKMRKSGSIIANIAWLERQLDDRISLSEEEGAEKVDYKNNNRHIIESESLEGVLLLMESWDKENSP